MCKKSSYPTVFNMQYKYDKGTDRDKEIACSHRLNYIRSGYGIKCSKF